ncbi:MAG: hypothetical protein ACI9Y1_002159, partial [Lentisphaeria bacterium]
CGLQRLHFLHVAFLWKSQDMRVMPVKRGNLM